MEKMLQYAVLICTLIAGLITIWKASQAGLRTAFKRIDQLRRVDAAQQQYITAITTVLKDRFQIDVAPVVIPDSFGEQENGQR